MEENNHHPGDPMAAVQSAPATTAHNLAQQMIAKRVRPSTAKGYANSMRIMGRWLAAHGGAVEEDGFPKLPRDHGLAVNFFGALVVPRHVPDPIFGAP